MLLGLSTENFAKQGTTLEEEVQAALKFGLPAVEIVPQRDLDVQLGKKIKPLLAQAQNISVFLSPPKEGADFSKYYEAGSQFAADVQANLAVVRPDFPQCASLEDLTKKISIISNIAEKYNINIAVSNWTSPTSLICTFDQMTTARGQLTSKFAVDLGNAFLGMGQKMQVAIGDLQGNLAAVRVSDATQAFADLPLGTGHINFPLMNSLFEHIEFTGPFFITHKRDSSLQRLRDSIEYWQYLQV